MTTENIITIGKIIICIGILAAATAITITTGTIPSPWDTLLVGILAILGLGDGVRIVVQNRRHNSSPIYRTQEDDRD